MNSNDVILNLVEKLIAEKEHNYILQQKIEQHNQQVYDEQENKD